MENQIKQTFEKLFSTSPTLVKSPGRVNLIGEHTDYNNGFVLPASINKYAYFAVKPNKLNEYRFYAYDLKQSFHTEVKRIEPTDVHWANYLLGVIAQMDDDGKAIPGFDCVFGGNIPIGAGMSSSAAIECGLAYSLNLIYGFDYSLLQLAQFSQRAEHEYAGVKCGIMDQFAILHGKENRAIKLDCEKLQHAYYDMDMSHFSIILVNTGVKHSLASSEYNKRRMECQEGVNILKKHYKTISTLRDVNMEMLKNYEKYFDSTIWNRCTYVIEENQRVEAACIALQEKDFNRFGELMYQSHIGLRDKYEVSCKELDELVEITVDHKEIVGARMMGGGFGGCTINLVNNEFIDDFKHLIRSNYKTPSGKQPEVITCIIGDGTKVL